MALIEIDGLPFLKMVMASMAMLNNQMVNPQYPLFKSCKLTLSGKKKHVPSTDEAFFSWFAWPFPALAPCPHPDSWAPLAIPHGSSSGWRPGCYCWGLGTWNNMYFYIYIYIYIQKGTWWRAQRHILSLSLYIICTIYMHKKYQIH